MGRWYGTSNFHLCCKHWRKFIATWISNQWFGDKTTCGSWKMLGSMKLLQHTWRSMYMERNTLPTHQHKAKWNKWHPLTQAGGSEEVILTDTNRIVHAWVTRQSLIVVLRWGIANVFFNALRNYQTDPALIYGFARTADLKKPGTNEATKPNQLFLVNGTGRGQGYTMVKCGSRNVWIKNYEPDYFSCISSVLNRPLWPSNATVASGMATSCNGEVSPSPGFLLMLLSWPLKHGWLQETIPPLNYPFCGTVNALTSSVITIHNQLSATVVVLIIMMLIINWLHHQPGLMHTIIPRTLLANRQFIIRLEGNLIVQRLPATTHRRFTTNAVCTCGTVTGLNSSPLGIFRVWSVLSGGANILLDYKLASSGQITAATSLSINLGGLNPLCPLWPTGECCIV